MQYAGTWNSGLISTHWVLVNPVSNQPVLQGGGNDFWLSVRRISRGIIMAGQAITTENLLKYPDENIDSESEFQNLFNYPIIGDDDLTRTVACVGNVLGTQTFSKLRYLRDNYNPHNATSATIYEHLPLINLVMHDPDYQIMGVEDNVYNSDKTLYEGLLNTAPTTGPFRGKNLNGVVRDWSSTSRCLWPQHNMDEQSHPDQMAGEQTLSGSYIAFPGLDYMLLHNLYYIAFRKEDLNAMKISYIVEPNVNLNTAYQIHIARRTYSQRAATIEAGCSILGNSVSYSAVKQIKLVPGFSANSSGGKTFVATIGKRTNNYDGSDYILPDGYNSSAPAMVRNNYVNSVDSTKSLLLDNQLIRNDYNIYPNPSRGKLIVSTNHFDSPVNYNIMNTNGVVVFKDRISTNNQIIDISTLSKGVYFISLHLKYKTETKKIILI